MHLKSELIEIDAKRSLEIQKKSKSVQLLLDYGGAGRVTATAFSLHLGGI